MEMLLYCYRPKVDIHNKLILLIHEFSLNMSYIFQTKKLNSKTIKRNYQHMKARLFIFFSILLFTSSVFTDDQSVSEKLTNEKGCLSCHEGIEPFSDGGMMATIKAIAKPFNDPGGCVVCHGGRPTAITVEEAHSGLPEKMTKQGGGPEDFYPDPGSIWIADKTCGSCHQGYAERLKKALMTTEAGKLQGNFWTWGLQNAHVLLPVIHL